MFKGTSEPMFESNDSTVMTFKRKKNLKGTNFRGIKFREIYNYCLTEKISSAKFKNL